MVSQEERSVQKDQSTNQQDEVGHELQVGLPTKVTIEGTVELEVFFCEVLDLRLSLFMLLLFLSDDGVHL